MQEKRHVLLILALVPLFLFATAAEEPQRSALTDFLGKTLNFILLFGGLAYLLVKPVRAFLEARRASIGEAIEQAAGSRKEAEERLESIRIRVTGLEKEVQRIQASGEIQGLKEKERISELSGREAQRIRTYSQQELEARVQGARRELREYAAELVISLAQARIQKRLTPDLHARLIDESIQALGTLHEKSGSD